MAKRAAATELNHENWDAEEESEDPGTFKPLSSSELKNRVIKKAKRSILNKETTSSGVSPFAGFSGFSAKTTSNSNPFSFLKKNNISGDSESSFFSKTNEEEKKENGSSSIQEEVKNTELIKSESSAVSDKGKPIRGIEYYRQLQSLNESVMKWMQLHLSKNSVCDFSPVFNDYKKHLDTLNVTYPVLTKNSTSEEKKDFFKKPASVKDNSPSTKKSKTDGVLSKKISSSFKQQNDETDYGAHFSSNTTNTSTFSFGIKLTPTATSSISSGPTTTSCEEELTPENKSFQFSFGLKKASSDSTPASKPFSFTPSTENAESGANEEVEYVPPKNDFVAVKEEDAFYSKRCKLFFKKGDGYAERGIGILHLKPLDGKTQLLIRADTNLGNILLNIVLSASLPMSRTGKNNILLVCVPNPPVDVKSESDSQEAIPYLIRVKTTEDADELLEILNKHKS